MDNNGLALPSAHSGALRVEPASPSQAEPPAVNASPREVGLGKADRNNALLLASICQKVRHSSASVTERDDALRDAAEMLRVIAHASSRELHTDCIAARQGAKFVPHDYDEQFATSREWMPIATAPKDGRAIRVRYEWDGDAVEDGVYFAETRQCMLGARAGECGPGWISAEVGLPVEPTHWQPLHSPAARRMTSASGLKPPVETGTGSMRSTKAAVPKGQAPTTTPTLVNQGEAEILRSTLRCIADADPGPMSGQSLAFEMASMARQALTAQGVNIPSSEAEG